MAARRILVLRSGRHLRVAMDALAARFQACHIGVVGTPGSGPALEQAGLAGGDAFVYDGPRFQPAAFFFSRTALAVRRWDYDQVAILWNDPDGQGQGNVDRTALAMSPGGYLAVTPDGTIVERTLWPQVRTEALRVLASLVVGAVLGVFLYGPALVMKGARRLLTWRPTRGHPPIADVTRHTGAPSVQAPEDDRRAGLYGPAVEAPHEGAADAAPRSVVLPFTRPEARQ